MIRFVVGPAGEAVPDVKRKLPGRGLWVTATRKVLEDKAFDRVVDLLESPPAPTETLHELMHGQGR